MNVNMPLQCRSKGNISGGARERPRREPLEGSGGRTPVTLYSAVARVI